MQLKDAVTRLADPDKATRDAALETVLAAKARAAPLLVDALKVPGAPVAKIALLVAALKARDAVRPLAELLHKGVLDFDARAVVARAFGELVDGRDAFDDLVKRAVLSLSKDDSGTTRQLTVKALRAIGDADAEARLEEMAVVDKDLAAREAARAALSELRASRPAPAGQGQGQGVIEEGGMHLDLEALVREHQAAAPSSSLPPPSGPHAALVQKLRDPRWAQRNAAVDEAVALAAGQRRDVVDTLVEVLESAHAGAKIGAAQALARIQAPEAARALLDAATGPATKGGAQGEQKEEKELRAIALKALASSLTGAEEGFAEPLVPLLKDADPFVRAGALLCLGRLADRVGARAATIALTDPHDHVKEAAAVALSEGTREDDQDLVLPLLAVLGGMPSPSTAAREAILLALARIHVEDPAVLLRLRHRVRPSVLGMTSSLRRTAIAILERCYTPDDPPPASILDDVLGRLADDHPEVRLLAASFLAAHLEPGLTGAVEALEDALDRAERPVSLLCLEALRRHDTPKARLALEAAAADPDETVAERARALLEGFTPTSEEWTIGAAPAMPGTHEPATAVEAVVEKSVEKSTAALPRRVRPARGGGEVVEAKDAPGASEDANAPDASRGTPDPEAADFEDRP